MRIRLPAVGALLILLLAAFAVPSASARPQHDLEWFCLAGGRTSPGEHTIRVPEWLADELIKSTRSYRGPCAEYGESARLGAGEQTAYTQTVGTRPVAVGWRVSDAGLEGLPYDPPNAGLWCYDKNADQTTDRMTECTGGYETALQLGPQFRRTVDSPFEYLLNNWNPMGHMPPHVYDLPHFDVHFYLQPESERFKIRTGPCPALVNCEDYRLGKKLPASRYLAPDYQDMDAVEPAMGNHLIDPTGPEFNGERFTHTFIYGVWNREVSYFEPMITHEWLSGLRDGTESSGCFPMKLPQAWQESGWYPTRYCTRHLDNRAELTVSMEGFVYRHAA
ncbi:MAG TPA: hypothetical protein VIP98_18255 [Microlunatus sp.]